MRTYPHCDTRVLHAPGECKYCDMSPDLQEMRVEQQIAFSGHEPKEGELPCPADQARPFAQHQAWPGNTPEGYPDLMSTMPSGEMWLDDARPPVPPANRWAPGDRVPKPEVYVSGPEPIGKRNMQHADRGCTIRFRRAWRCTRGYHTDNPCALVPRWWNIVGRIRGGWYM